MARKRTLPFLLVVTAALALAAPASAKELTGVAICGLRDACARIGDREQLRLVPVGGSTSVAAPRRQPFYWMVLTISHGDDAEEFGLYYLPESNLLGANGARPGAMVWLPIGDPRSAELLRNAVEGIEPHPAPGAWPRELKSAYRVIPDDAAGIALPSSPPNHATPAPARSENLRGAAPGRSPRSCSRPPLRRGSSLGVGRPGFRSAVYRVTPPSAAAPSGRRPAPPGSRLRGSGRRPR